MMRTLYQQGNKSSYFNLLEVIYKKLTACILLNGGLFQIFPWGQEWDKMLTVIISIQYSVRGQCNKAMKWKPI